LPTQVGRIPLWFLLAKRWRDRVGFVLSEVGEQGLDCGDCEGQISRVRGVEQDYKFGDTRDDRGGCMDDSSSQGVGFVGHRWHRAARI
jgi:hypothetical protein